MKLSRASTYALYGLSYLVEQPSGLFVPLSAICKHYGLPEKHLAKIFQALSKAGILRASRGPNGGFSLAKSPRKVSSLEVVQIIDGPIPETACFLPRNPCKVKSSCTVARILSRLEQTTTEMLRRTMLADLARPSKGPLPPRPPPGSG